MLADDTLIPERRAFNPKWLFMLVAVLLAGGAGVLLWRTFHGPTAGPQKYVTARVQRTTLADTISATGPVTAAGAVPLNFKNSGKVSEIDVHIGDSVKAGQVLAKLDPTDLQSRLNQAKANLAAAQANYNKLVQGPRAADVEAAQVSIDAANRQLADARSALAAAQAVAAKDASASQHAVDNTKKNLTDVQAQVDAATAGDRTAVQGAQQALADAQKQRAALPAVVAQQIQQAKDKLFSDQTTFDAQVARGQVSKEQRQAALDADQAAVDQANASAQQQTVQAQTAVNRAQTALNNAEAALKNDLAKFQGQMASAQAQVASAQDALNTAGAKDAQGVQNAQAQLSSAVSAQETAKANYDKAVSLPSQADLANAKAQVDAQRAQVDLAQANLDAATLRAPSDGTVTAISGAVGQWLTGGALGGTAANAAAGNTSSSSNNGASGFISLTSLSGLQVSAQVNEADIGRVHPGDAVTFTVDAFPGQTLTGKVAAVQPLGTASSNIVTYTVLIGVNTSKARLLPGMTANVTLTVAKRDNVLAVPSAAIAFAQAQIAAGRAPGSTSSNSALAVIVVDTKGKTKLQPIQTGANDGRNTEVVSGLSEGQRVAIGTKS